MRISPSARRPPLLKAVLIGGLAALAACDIGSDPLLAGATEATQVQLVLGNNRLAMSRSSAGWTTPDLDGAPVRADRLNQLLARLAELQPTEPDPSCPDPIGTIVLTGPYRFVARVHYVPGRSDCPTLIVRPGAPPAAAGPIAPPPPQPEHWVALDPPRIDPRSVASVTLISPSGAQRLAPEAPAARALLAPLSRLSLAGLRASDSINWAGARYAQLALSSGLIVEAQLTPTHVRLTADAPPGAPQALSQRAEQWRDLRRFAFRLPPAPRQ